MSVNLVANIGTIAFVRRKIFRPLFQFSRSEFAQLFKGGLPFALTTILVAIYFNFDTVLVSKLVSAQAAGVYRAAYNLILPLMMVTASVSGAVFPFISQKFKLAPTEIGDVVRKSSAYLLFFGVPIAVIGSFEAGNIIHFLYAREYSDSALSLSILVWFLPVAYLTNLFGNSLGAMEQQSYVLKVAVANVAFNICANMILIPMYAQNGAAAVTVLTEILGFTLLSRKMHAYVPSIIQASLLGKLALASIPCLLFLYFKPGLWAPLTLTLAVLIYGFGLMVVGAFSLQEIRKLILVIRGSHAN